MRAERKERTGISELDGFISAPLVTVQYIGELTGANTIRSRFANTTLKQEVSQISEGLNIWEIEI